MTRPAIAALVVLAALATALPATAATPTFNGTVGPGFTIKMTTKPTKAGKIKLVVADKASIHNFHLTGPGVNVKTSVRGTGTKTFTVTLKKGTYKFVCDPHASQMQGVVHGQVVERARAPARPEPRPLPERDSAIPLSAIRQAASRSSRDRVDDVRAVAPQADPLDVRAGRPRRWTRRASGRRPARGRGRRGPPRRPGRA